MCTLLFGRGIVLLLAGVLLFGGVDRLCPLVGQSVGAASAQTRPNIVLILTDDLDLEPMQFMPTLQALLVNQGLTFENAFTVQSLCCPARASVLRGQYPHNHKIQSNALPDGGFPRFQQLGHEHSTIATWLQAAGYRTVLIGKYLNGYSGSAARHIPPGWTEWQAKLGSTGYFNWKLSENGRAVRYGDAPQDYETDVLAARTRDFIVRTTTATTQPFFVYLAPYAPHGVVQSDKPPIPAPRHRGMFADRIAPRTPSFNEADISDKPKPDRNESLLTATQIRQIDTIYQARLESLLALDELIATVVETLEEVGELDDTYIFFTSDNGFHLGQHRQFAGKGLPYEEDIRIPFIVRGPGVPAGQVRQHLVLNIDLAPTFAQIAGASTPSFVDGRSLVPLLGRTSPRLTEWRQGFLVERWPDSEVAVGGAKVYQALRTREYMYIEYWRQRALYDIVRDPDQLSNFYSSADSGLIAELTIQLDALRDCAGASCRTAENGF